MTVTRRSAIGSLALSGLTLASAIEGVAHAAGNAEEPAMMKGLDEGLVIDRFQTDRNGETHFSKCRIPMSRGADGHIWSKGIVSKNVRFLDLPAGHDTPPHGAPERQFVVMLFGEVKVTVSDGESRSWRSGEIFLATDAGIGKGHRTQTIGGPARVLFIPVGDEMDLDAWAISDS